MESSRVVLQPFVASDNTQGTLCWLEINFRLCEFTLQARDAAQARQPLHVGLIYASDAADEAHVETVNSSGKLESTPATLC